MERYKVSLSRLAEQDVNEIIRYISVDLAVPDTAMVMLETIEESLKSLSTMPEIHPLVQDDVLASAGYRKLIIKNYIAFYLVDNMKKEVDVIRVLYSRRDWHRLI
ncbi:MAG: type II toxin-antitoxin system RelE/ParE family toxin [Coriobacteriia bacterium]|nr:type II toxin-antitoxin system RelE/ParE family toxin [Coriobacteriia bacterium]